jgi:hypothetical protein
MKKKHRSDKIKCLSQIGSGSRIKQKEKKKKNVNVII